MSDEPDLVSTRGSAIYYTDIVEGDPALQARLARSGSGGLYQQMFLDDVSRMLPWRRGFDDGFTATVTADDHDRAATLIREALPSRYGSARTLEDGVRGLTEEATQSLLLGPTTYEIDYLHQRADPNKVPVAFRLELINPKTLDELDGQPIQYVPTRPGRPTAPNGLSYVTLDPTRLVIIQLAPNLASTIGRVLTIFAAADARRMPPMTMLTDGHRSGFNLAEHTSQTNLTLLTATRDIGWTGRGLYSKDVLEPHAIWRHLRFLKFQITVRDAILAGLDEAIARAGHVLGFSATIAYSGLTDDYEITEAEADLRTGGRPFKELFAIGP
jgi:hypothetical protein